MTLTEREVLLTRLVDGLADDEERARARREGIDPEPTRAIGRLLRRAVVAEAGEVPDVAGAVLSELGLEDGWAEASAALAEAVGDEAGEAPDLAGAVLSELGLEDGWAGASAALAEAVGDEAGEAPDLAGSVLSELGLDDGWAGASAALAEAVGDEAGDAPDVAGAVLSELGLAAPVAVEAPVVEVPAAEAPVIPLRRSWRMPAVGLAAAAAALFAVVGGLQRPAAPGGEVFDVAAVNHVEIEDLTTDADAVVQVLQFGEDAPPIIFIDVLDPADDLGGSEGATL